MANVGWVGLGKLGAPCAAALQHHGGHVVYGYDLRGTDPSAYSWSGQRPVELVESIADAVKLTDEVVYVAVQTPHSPLYGGDRVAPELRRDFEYAYLVNAVRGVCLAATLQRKHVTVAIVSTVLPGTFNRYLRTLGSEYVTFVYHPFFIAMGTEVDDFVHPEMVLYGIDRDGDHGSIDELYSGVHDAPVATASIDSAELAKVAYNTFITMKIVFANALMELCEGTGADVDEVTDALVMGTQRVVSARYLRAGMGDGGACFPPGEIVITEDGPRPIETVREGDRVLTFDGTLQQVLQIWSRPYSGDLVVVQAQGLPATRMTVDHPVMARKDLRVLRPDGRKSTYRGNDRNLPFARSDVVETAASDLTTDHLVLWPEHEVIDFELPDHVTPEYLELAGWYLAEGSVDLSARRGRLRFDLHARESVEGDRIAELLTICAPIRTSGRGNNAKVTIKVEDNRRFVRLGSIGLARQLVSDFGKGAAYKFIPNWALWGNEKISALLLEGMIKGDGHVNGNGVSYSTISEQLAWGAHLLMTRLGCHPNIRVIPARSGHQRSFEVRVRNRREARSLFSQINISAKPIGVHEVRSDDWRPVLRLFRESFSGTVHNLWVAGTNTYVVGCGAVHNCHPRDNVALAALNERLGSSVDLNEFLVRAREAQTGWLADFAARWHEQTEMSVAVLGLTYKPEVPLTDGSPALLLVSLLEERGISVNVYDPVLNLEESLEHFLDRFGPRVYVIATEHAQLLRQVYPVGSVVIDPFGTVTRFPGVTYVTPGRKG